MSIQPTERTRRRAQRAAEPDLVDRIMAAVVERAPELAPQVAELEAAVRDQFAGDRGWVRKRNATRPDLARLVLEQFNGRNVTEVARTLKISRATVYRVLRIPGGG
jgi:DNA invertase Pin-like site-specific DNA recombinase